MAIVSSGQITITDLNDAPVLYAYITASQPTTQVYSEPTATYNPSRATTNQVLQLKLQKAGSATDLLGTNVPNVSWTKRVGATSTAVTGTGTSQGTVTISINEGNANGGVRYSVSGTWNDPVTGLSVPFDAFIDLPVITAGTSASFVTVINPNGDTFRNNQPAVLTTEATFFKAGVADSTSKEVRWFYQDSTATTTSGGHADGGDGWRLVTSVATTTDAYVSVAPGTTTLATTTLNVKPALVASALAVKVVVTSNSIKYTGIATLRDMDDPIQLVIQAPEGDIIKNSNGTINLTARLFQLGAEIDAWTTDAAATIYTYTWWRYNQNGVKDATAAKTGKTGAAKKLQVTAANVQVKATYICEVTDA